MKVVALKAFSNIVAEWQIPIHEAAALADMSESTWKRARKPGYTGDLTHDQLLRLSAMVGIYKALKLYFSMQAAHEDLQRRGSGSAIQRSE